MNVRYVTLQVLFQFKRSVTVWAFIWSFSSVFSKMSTKIIQLMEALAAIQTVVNPVLYLAS